MRTNTIPVNFMSKFQQFRQNFKGNPQEQVQQLLNSGKVSQADYNRAVQLAQQFQRMFGGRI
jgi:hypothetical protein